MARRVCKVLQSLAVLLMVAASVSAFTEYRGGQGRENSIIRSSGHCGAVIIIYKFKVATYFVFHFPNPVV